MYRPAHFEPPDDAAMHALMAAHPLAAVVIHGPDGLACDHVPLEFDATSQTLRGHVARANPLWRHGAGQPVLAVFSGPQTYITPSYYPSKAEHHQVVPTWNYAVVHAHGTLAAVDDAPWLHALVSRLTAHHESGRGTPWAVSDAPDDYVQKMLRAIVGIEIAVQRLDGKWKTSQNRSAADRAGVVTGLQADGRADSAGLVPT